MGDQKASIILKIEQSFPNQEKPKRACLNLVDYLFSGRRKIRGMSASDLAEAMQSEDPATVRESISYCSSSLGLIVTYAEAHLRDLSFELTTEELNEAVRTGRVTNPKTGVLEMFSYINHPLYKLAAQS
ncbi:hypothetical protein [Pseudomonas putida]|uniref:Uncharacterized protein n=1 Tax=Pseudomonas putida TaxID=303 RepID=A0A8I1EIP0_PSEPU|nr:hypothetical protein [Pseudomonas putida]MBI6885838.1 hypothetical protein [Pseudomonas putida]